MSKRMAAQRMCQRPDLAFSPKKQLSRKVERFFNPKKQLSRKGAKAQRFFNQLAVPCRSPDR
jgi:hypothetical protein